MKKIMSVVIALAALLGGISYAQNNISFGDLYSAPTLVLNQTQRDAPKEASFERNDSNLSKQEIYLSSNADIESTSLMKNLLKGFPIKTRHEFAGTMVITNGHVVSLSTAALEQTLDSAQIAETIKPITADIRNLKKSNSDTKGKLSELLRKLPNDVGTEFIDNMMFKNGRTVSIYIDGLRKVLPDHEIKKILLSLYASQPYTSAAGSKTLCGDGFCYDMACTKENNGPWHCADKKGWTCGTDCK